MYKIDEIGGTFVSLPPNLQTIENQCYSYALDRQIQKFKKMADRLTIWTDLDNVQPKYYDYLAMCIRAPYYKSEYTDDQKLNLIKTAIMSHRFSGTRSALDQLISIIFEDAEFVPWDSYDGVPYHFKVNVSDIMTEDAAELFTRVLKKVKAARSIMDEISINREAHGKLWIGTAPTVSCKGAAIRE